MSIYSSLVIVALAVLLTGCTGALTVDDFKTGSLAEPAVSERPQDDYVISGKKHFADGSYGLAERSFRRAVESNSKSAEAWLGLAASFDRLRRFDLAGRAYDRFMALEGRTLPLLNNLAFHHMLRGNLKKARKLLEEAARKDPANPVVQGNFRLLATWKTGEPEVASLPL